MKATSSITTALCTAFIASVPQAKGPWEKTSTPGTILSPVIPGGLTKLKFNYGQAYTDTKLAFVVNLIQNQQIVKTWTVTNDAPEKFKVYTFEESANVTGNFTIEIINQCPSQLDSNKDRVSIWNLAWEN